MHVASRPAAVGDKLVSFKFTMSKGLAPADGDNVAVCVLPGTEIAFDAPISTESYFENGTYIDAKTHASSVARFRQVDVENKWTHHDALELADGTIVKLHFLVPGQTATVLQLPAAPKTEAEAQEQKRLEVVG